MNLIVSYSGDSRGILHWKGRHIDCALGHGGITDSKKEGDGATPIGIFALRSLYFRQDAIKTVSTALKTTVITQEMGWCDDLDDANYNLPVPLPYNARHEALWRDDSVYDLIVPLGYNDGPIVPGSGSCIFMHVARENYTPTEGCVALSRRDLLQVLAEIDLTTQIEIST